MRGNSTGILIPTSSCQTPLPVNAFNAYCDHKQTLWEPQLEVDEPKYKNICQMDKNTATIVAHLRAPWGTGHVGLCDLHQGDRWDSGMDYQSTSELGSSCHTIKH